MEAATRSAAETFKSWKDVPVQQRQRVMLKLQALIREHTEELAESITLEQVCSLWCRTSQHLTNCMTGL